MEERFRTELMEFMAVVLDTEQRERLDYIITSLLMRYSVEERKAEIAIYDGGNDRIVNTYIASMRLEGKSESTIDQYRRAINGLLDDVNKNVEDITTNEIRYHLAKYQESGVSKVSVNNKRRFLSAFFSWLTVEEYIVKNPMLTIKKVKEEKVIKHPFSDKDVEVIKEHTKNIKERALVEFLLSTGCRVSEVMNLDCKNVNMLKNRCVVMGKGKKERTVYISDKAMYYLSKYISSRKDTCESLFANRNGGRLSKQSIWQILSRIGKEADISKVHPHRFRRTFATNALNKGMPLQHVQQLMGHKSLDTTMIYCTLDDEDIRLEHKKIA